MPMFPTHSVPNYASAPDRDASLESGTYRCPRCPVRLPRVEFVKHLWLEHRLVLDGHEVREPWQLIEEWGHEYSRSGDPELLARCRALADRLDADQGRLRVERSLLAHGVKEEGEGHQG